MALGGNSLVRPGERGSAVEQRGNLRRALAALTPVLASDSVVITHGNGPQVGNELLRHERGAAEAPPLPLSLAVALTQAEIGSLIASELAPLVESRVACVVTHVVVDEGDPAFGEPTKPIGPFYAARRARELQRERGWHLVEDAGRGWRRVVPSPAAIEIVELDAVAALVRAGLAVIACGGGGVPVVRRDGRLEGVDAVVDKDGPSALLAAELKAARLLVLTGAEAVVRGYGTPAAEPVRALTVAEADALAPELAAGSMRPKVEACARFVRATGAEALIASAESLAEALAGRAGTRVVPD